MAPARTIRITAAILLAGTALATPAHTQTAPAQSTQTDEPAEKVARHDRPLERITRRDAIIIGIAQACALVPGVSRSGATLTAGLFLGFDRTSAARYSFLLSVPAVVMSGLFELRKIGDGSLPVGGTIIGTIAAFIVGYASIAWMLKWLAGHTVAIFTGYRVLLGIGVLALASAGAIS